LPRTPDDFPGTRIETQIILIDQYGTQIPEEGGLTFSDGYFSYKDLYGIFNPRFATGSADGSLSLGEVPAGIVDDYGIYPSNPQYTLSIWGTRTDGSGNISVVAVADVDVAAINVNHKILS